MTGTLLNPYRMVIDPPDGFEVSLRTPTIYGDEVLHVVSDTVFMTMHSAQFSVSVSAWTKDEDGSGEILVGQVAKLRQWPSSGIGRQYSDTRVMIYSDSARSMEDRGPDLLQPYADAIQALADMARLLDAQFVPGADATGL